VGNFDHVLEDSYRKSYLPFLETLLNHPSLKVVLHYSGHLLSWIQQHHPETIEIIKKLVEKNRAEILSGGFYEPILSILPEEDRHRQITELSRFIEKNFQYTPKGMWLAERVWEPQMPKFISKAGLEYLPVDDYHFKLNGLEEGDLLGYYITEDENCKISVFPGSEKLRYYIPFKTVEDTMSYLREISMRGGNPLLTLADDGEKFGVWPNTYKHCYENKWLDNFFSEIEKNSDWIETTTFSEYSSKFQPLGMVYLPTASYREMGAWSLPSEASLEYEYVIKELEKIIGERSKHLLRGGIWRLFMVKYPESNHLHKRMFMISQKVNNAHRINNKKGRDAQLEVMKGQCNDAYWHGIFGGLYLPHLRSSLYRHLLRAESLANDILQEDSSVEQIDFDCDGFEDIIVNTKKLTLLVTEKGGSLTELSLNKEALNMLDILSRRPEAYHSKIAETSGSGSGNTGTIHNNLSVKEQGLSDYLIYDKYRRASLVDHFFPPNTHINDLISGQDKELGDFVSGKYSLNYSKKGKDIMLYLSRDGTVMENNIKIDKSIGLTKTDGIRVDYLVEGTFSGLFAIEMNVSLLGSPHAILKIGDKTLQINSSASHENINKFSLEAEFLGCRINYRFSEDINLWHYPVETVSLSEQGVERLYQGTAFLFVMDIELRGRKNLWFSIDFIEGNT
jgi:alpha-amylase